VLLNTENPDSKTQETANKQHLWTTYLQAVAKNISQPVSGTDRENTSNHLV